LAERGLPVIEVGESGWAVTVTVTVAVAVAVASGKVQDTGFCFVGQERVDVKLMMENVKCQNWQLSQSNHNTLY